MFCKHNWKWHSYQVTNVYETSRSRYPYKSYTSFKGLCTKCGKPKVKNIRGAWTAKGA